MVIQEFMAAKNYALRQDTTTLRITVVIVTFLAASLIPAYAGESLYSDYETRYVVIADQWMIKKPLVRFGCLCSNSYELEIFQKDKKVVLPIIVNEYLHFDQVNGSPQDFFVEAADRIDKITTHQSKMPLLVVCESYDENIVERFVQVAFVQPIDFPKSFRRACEKGSNLLGLSARAVKKLGYKNYELRIRSMEEIQWQYLFDRLDGMRYEGWFNKNFLEHIRELLEPNIEQVSTTPRWQTATSAVLLFIYSFGPWAISCGLRSSNINFRPDLPEKLWNGLIVLCVLVPILPLLILRRKN